MIFHDLKFQARYILPSRQIAVPPAPSVWPTSKKSAPSPVSRWYSSCPFAYHFSTIGDANALDPNVQTAAQQRVDLPQSLTVDAIRDAVVLPGDVVARILCDA